MIAVWLTRRYRGEKVVVRRTGALDRSLKRAQGRTSDIDGVHNKLKQLCDGGAMVTDLLHTSNYAAIIADLSARETDQRQIRGLRILEPIQTGRSTGEHMGLRMQGNRSAQGQYGRNQGRMRSVAPVPRYVSVVWGFVGLHADGEVRR